MAKLLDVIDCLSGNDLVLHEILTLVKSCLPSNTIQSLPRSEGLELTDQKASGRMKRTRKLTLLKLRGLGEVQNHLLRYASMRAIDPKISNTFKH